MRYRAINGEWKIFGGSKVVADPAASVIILPQRLVMDEVGQDSGLKIIAVVSVVQIPTSIEMPILRKPFLKI